MLHEHQVGLLAFRERVIPLGEFNIGFLGSILRKRRIGDHSVKPSDLTRRFVSMLRILQRATLPDVGTANAVQDHIHLADSPSPAIQFLTGQREVSGIAADFFDIMP